MKKFLNNMSVKASAAVVVGLLAGAETAHANDFGNIAQNIIRLSKTYLVF